MTSKIPLYKRPHSSLFFLVHVFSYEARFQNHEVGNFSFNLVTMAFQLAQSKEIELTHANHLIFDIFPPS